MKSKGQHKPSSHSQNPYHKYKIHELIGQGQFGKVYRATSLPTFNASQPNYAVKVIPSLKLKKNPKLKQLLKNQIEILCRVDHPNIIKFEEIFCWENRIYMVYEYCEGGSLEDILPITQYQASFIFKGILSACEFAEKNNILHRDIKPANILFKNGKVKVADWGFSKFLEGTISTESYVGSPAYMAPEILKGQVYTNKADIWSFGVMMFESIVGKLPWQAQNIKELKQMMKKRPNIPQKVGETNKMIISACLSYNPQKRSSFREIYKIMKHPQIETQILNPQNEQAELSDSQIKKCTYYLQFSKQSTGFLEQEVRELCLEYILKELYKMKEKQWGGSKLRRELKEVRTQKKIINKKIVQTSTPKAAHSEAFTLLDKQICLITKIKPNSLSHCIPKSTNIQKLIVQKIMSSLSVIFNGQLQDEKKLLIELNSMLNIFLFDEGGSELVGQSFGHDLQALSQANRSYLMKLINFKILYIQELFL